MRVDPDDLRAYAHRDWSPYERLTAEDWGRRPITDHVRVSDQLWAEARAVHPDWPSAADRLADYTHHCRLAALLRQARGVGAL